MMPNKIDKPPSRFRLIFNPLLYVVFGIGLVASVILYLQPKDLGALNPDTNCPCDITAVTAVLIDVTDGFSADQKNDVNGKLKLMIKSTPTGGLVQVYLLNKKNTGSVEFSKCNPGDGSDRASIFVTRALAKEEWENQFGSQVVKAFETAEAVTPADASKVSHIIEAIKSVSLQCFGGERTPISCKTLYIVSDLLENSSELNHYKSKIPEFSTFKERPYYLQHKPRNLKGADVHVLYIPRPTQHDKNWILRHKDFWTSLFIDCGATVSFQDI